MSTSLLARQEGLAIQPTSSHVRGLADDLGVLIVEDTALPFLCVGLLIHAIVLEQHNIQGLHELRRAADDARE